MDGGILDMFERAPEEVRAAAVPVRVRKGEPILRLNEENRCLCILLEGEAMVYGENSNNYSAALYTYHSGEFFGEMELFREDGISLAVMAKRDSTVIKLHRNYVLLWMKKDFEFTLMICRKLASTDGGSRLIINGRKPLPLKCRYLYTLYQWDRAGELGSLTKAGLCDRLGTDIRCVNRIVAECRERGIACYENRRFRITDYEKLEKMLEEYGVR